VIDNTIVLRNGGWDLDELERYEDAKLKASVERDVYERIVTANPQKHDLSVRRFIALNAPDLFEPSFQVAHSKTKGLTDAVFTPNSFEELTIFNCFFLRFPDYSPHWALKEIRTDNSFMDAVKVSVLSWILHSSNTSRLSKIFSQE
jgi:hypothetical protein